MRERERQTDHIAAERLDQNREIIDMCPCLWLREASRKPTKHAIISFVPRKGHVVAKYFRSQIPHRLPLIIRKISPDDLHLRYVLRT